MSPQRPKYLFFLMFTIFLLLNINYTVLRSVRNTLAVVDLGTGAHSIPFFELFGALPGAILMTWGLSWLIHRFSIHRVFFITLSVFIGFFLFFAFAIYPSVVALKQNGQIGSEILQFFSLVFYVLAELWKPALAMILFWGLVNQYTPITEAKKLYAPLMLGGSLGSIIAGPIVSMCTSEISWKLFAFSKEQWANALTLMMCVIFIIGAITGIMYYWLWRQFTLHYPERIAHPPIKSSTEDFSLKKDISFCMQIPQLRLLSWMVIADYIAYGLGEVIFLDILKLKFPQSCDYCNYLGYLSFLTGIFTVISSLLISPFILQKCRWKIAALSTPLCLLITEGAFFVFLRANLISSHWFGWSEIQWMNVVVLLGSLQYCLCRGIKYTLSDASKELTFVLMPEVQKMKGKLLVDGICARLGRGWASALSIYFIKISGGILASSFLTGVFAIGMAASGVFATCKLGRLIDRDPVKIPISQGNA